MVTLSKYDRVGDVSDAFNTAKVHVEPSKGNDATDNHSNVLRLPKPIMCSFNVNAALMDMTRIQKLTKIATQTGPIKDQITVS